MLATPGPEPVAEAQELRLIDRRQDDDHRRLDDLVLQRRDAERPLSAVRLRYVRPARRQRPVRAGVDAPVEIGEGSLEILRVLFPGHRIDPRRRSSFKAKNAARSMSTLTWCSSAVSFSFLFLVTASRMRACAWDTAARLCVRTVLCSPAFPSIPPLPSIGSAAGRPALFAGFIGTMGGSDFSGPCITVYGPRPSPCGPPLGGDGQTGDLSVPEQETARMPGSNDDAEPTGARDRAPGRVAFCRLEGIGTPDGKSFAAQWLAYAYPCQRFASASRPPAHELGADVVRYSFIVRDLHPLSLAGLPTLPVNSVQHVGQLRRGDRDRPVSRRRPDETAALQPLGVERHADPVMPENLDQVTSFPSENIQITGVPDPIVPDNLDQVGSGSAKNVKIAGMRVSAE